MPAYPKPTGKPRRQSSRQSHQAGWDPWANDAPPPEPDPWADEPVVPRDDEDDSDTVEDLRRELEITVRVPQKLGGPHPAFVSHVNHQLAGLGAAIMPSSTAATPTKKKGGRRAIRPHDEHHQDFHLRWVPRAHIEHLRQEAAVIGDDINSRILQIIAIYCES